MTVLYRKYRPQTVSELDSSDVRRQLSTILSSGRIPHAFLFTGPKGIGKTSAARIIAKAINCEKRTKDKGISPPIGLVSRQQQAVSFEPCNECETCRSITDGANLDVLEIDGASNRGIDEIRDLREKIKLAPSFCRYKVYIIDEVHMLTNEAFNALLKTLEEPPPHAVFILCTTDPHKLPETIISRCQRISFKKATISDLTLSLKRAAKGEGLEVSDEVLGLISRKAEGSFRDGQKILDQLLSGGDFSKSAFEALFLPSSFTELSVFVDDLIKKDAKEAIVFINKIADEGRRMDEFIEDLLSYFRMIFLTASDVGEELVAPDLTQEAFAQISKQARELKVSDLEKLIELFSRAKLDLKDAVISQLPLEMAVIEWRDKDEKREAGTPEGSRGSQEDVVSVSSASVSQEKKDALEKTAPVLDKAEKEQALETKKESEVGKVQELNAEKIKDEKEKESTADEGLRENLKPAENEIDRKKESDLGETREIDLKKICQLWPEILRKIKPYNHTVEALLRAAKPIDHDGKSLTLEVFYKFHKEKIEKEPVRSLVEKVAGEVLGTDIRLKCILGDKPGAEGAVDNVAEVAKEDDPLVKAAEAIFVS